MEKWLWVTGYEGFYQVNNKGDIKSLERLVDTGRQVNKRKERMLSQQISRCGYKKIVLCRDKKRVDTMAHILVAKAFIHNPESLPQVNHKNGIKTDNRVENLEWMSAKDNTHHAIKMGLAPSQIGEVNPKAKLTESDVRYIRSLFTKGKRGVRESLSKKFGVTKGIISRVARRESWKHIK
jgi:hypothetical protein